MLIAFTAQVTFKRGAMGKHSYILRGTDRAVNRVRDLVSEVLQRQRAAFPADWDAAQPNAVVPITKDSDEYKGVFARHIY